MRKFSKKQIVIGGAAAIAIAVGAGAAYAYWTSGGTGNGNAGTATSTDFTVTVDDNTLNDLSPDGPTDTVDYHIQNTGSGAEFATTATASVVDTSNAGCDASNFTVSNNTFPAAGISIASNATEDYSFDVQMIDTGANQDACQGVTVHLQVVVA